MDAILRADTPLLVNLAGVLQATGLGPRSETPPVPPGGDSGARTS